MKQWKLVLVALLAVLLVCACTSALADEATTAPDPHQCERSAGTVTTSYTCGTAGVKTFYVCGDPYCPKGNNTKVAGTETIGPAGAHSYLSYPSGSDTCSAAQTVRYECTVCHDEYTVVVDTVKDHVFEYQWTVDPTCEKPGYAQMKCKYCDATQQKNPKDALGHDMVKQVKPVSEATCAAPAVYKYVCANKCGHTYTQAEGDKLQHVLVDVNKVAATCTKDGTSAHKECVRGGCDYTEGKTVLAKTGHKFDLTPVVTNPTCEAEGYTTVWCSNCKDPSVTEKQNKKPATGHTWTLTGRTSSTCSTAGEEKYVCHCGKTKTEYLPVAEHTFDKWEEHTVPTCYIPGQEVSYCGGGCGLATYRDVPALGHNYPTKPQTDVKATCTTDGWKIWECTNGTGCPTIREDVPATGHTKKDYIVDEPTCNLAGLKNIVCGNTGCNHVFERNIVIPANGHNGDWKVVVPATAAKDGEAHKICKVCGDILDKKVVTYTVMRYSNTATAFGPTTRELVGGSDWARVTPIDLSVEGTFTYPLVASNQYVVGTVTVTIANGSFVVNYDTAASQIKVTNEALMVYADKAALAAGTAEAAAFGTPIAIGEDAKVLLSVVLTVDYDAVGAGVTGFRADAAQIEAMKAIID